MPRTAPPATALAALVAAPLIACTDPPRGDHLADVEVTALAAAHGTAYAVDRNGGMVAMDDQGVRALAPSVNTVLDLQVHGDRLWWATGDIVSMPLAGGEIRVEAADQAPHHIEVDDQAIYWKASGFGATAFGVWRQALAGGAPVSLAPRVQDFRVDGARVYWCQDDGCWTVDRQGGPATLAFAVVPRWDWQVQAGVLYYVAQSGDAPPDQLWRVTGPDAAPELIIDTHTSNDEHDDASNPVGAPLVAPDGQIYIVTGKRVISLGGDTVIEPPVSVGQVAVDDTYVYVAGGASVWRAPR